VTDRLPSNEKGRGAVHAWGWKWVMCPGIWERKFSLFDRDCCNSWIWWRFCSSWCRTSFVGNDQHVGGCLLSPFRSWWSGLLQLVVMVSAP
jgi:hypothetical protein